MVSSTAGGIGVDESPSRVCQLFTEKRMVSMLMKKRPAASCWMGGQAPRSTGPFGTLPSRPPVVLAGPLLALAYGSSSMK